jgi:hypothetical protein
MNHTEYLKVEDADTALAVRLAVTMGWSNIELTPSSGIILGESVEWSEDLAWRTWMPFADASIPYGLIGRGVQGCMGPDLGGFYAWCVSTEFYKSEIHKSKTHAIINAYCQADPMGHWAKFIGSVK